VPAPPIPPNLSPPWPRPSDAVRAALEAAYADGSWGRYHGPHCERLRQELARLCGTSHAWLCSSGTIAVELALRGLKVEAGDDVILAAYDFPGNFRAIEAIGARPVLVDLSLDSWTIDVEQVAAAVSPQTRAIIVSHLHGSLADMRRLREWADSRRLAVVEDACQVPGAIVAGKPAGAWGDCGVFSFGGSKLLTAGRGGAIVTSRDDALQRIKIHCERGNDAFPLSELQAAVLVPQIPQLALANQQRLNAVTSLLLACGDLPGLAPLRLPANPNDQPAFYKLPWLLAGNSDNCGSAEFEQSRSRFIAAMQAEGVAMDEGFRGFARRSSQRCRVVGALDNSRRAAARTVILHHPVLLETSETISRVAQAIQKVASQMLAHYFANPATDAVKRSASR
jgi:dTDP-4-amino-4,6-dideoxygalactose transaminase